MEQKPETHVTTDSGTSHHLSGRVIYQQVGPQAIDGIRDFLREAEAKKDFVIYDQELKAKFWALHTKKNLGTPVPDPDRVFEHSWSIIKLPGKDEKSPIVPVPVPAALPS